MSQTTNNNNNKGKNPNNKKKDFFNTESGTYISFAELKAEIEAGNVTPASLYADYEVYDASTDQAKELMELAIKKVTPKAAPQPNVQAIKDKATQEAQTIKSQAEAEAKTIKDKATEEAQTIKDKATQEAQTIKSQAEAEAKTIKSQAEAEANTIKAQATKDTTKDPDKPAKKSKATATNLIAAGKIWKYVDDNGLVLVDMTGSQAKVDLISRINDKNIESRADLEVFKKYGMSVELVPVRKLGDKLFVARKTADDFTVNTIADIITILNEEEEEG
ncbi:MAG: hypothetical protein K6G36_01905 [Candidatus Saccharibacteria bacterium]|nr:hypothetical protein [Candidatus Saccharibacteria bacterium]